MTPLEQSGYLDKTGWGSGPWQEEPDRVYWIDATTDYDCLILRSPTSGSLCGYVGVPSGHPAYGQDYNAVNVNVHGGLTYGARCQENGLICHTARSGRPDDVYWLGFDCSQAFDIMPAIKGKLLDELENPIFAYQISGTSEPTRYGHMSYGSESWRDTYRDLAYVINEVEGLAAQLAAMRHH